MTIYVEKGNCAVSGSRSLKVKPLTTNLRPDNRVSEPPIPDANDFGSSIIEK